MKTQSFPSRKYIWKLRLQNDGRYPSLNFMTPLVLKPEYSVQTLSITQLLMPWLLVSLGIQQPWYWLWKIISYTLFADADTGIYPHAASQYHARLKAKRGIAMLSVDKFPYPRKQTRGNEFIPCSNNICDILKRFCSFKIPAITLIWPKSPYKHSVSRSYRSGKESGRRSESPLWRHQWRSFVFISHADDVKREIRLHISRLLTNQKRELAWSMGYIWRSLYSVRTGNI